MTMMRQTVVALLSVALCLPAVNAGGWAYEDAGEWGTDYPACGKESRTEYNSPIDLSGRIVTGNLDQPIRLNDAYYFPQRDVYISNNGYTLQLDLPRSKGYSLQFNHGETLGNIPFYLQQIHFHWGANDKEGTEHTFDGNMYALEMHFVHYNGNFDGIAAAAANPRGLSVLGLLFKIGAHNKAFDSMLNTISDAQVKFGLTDATIESIVLSDFFPKNDEFYNYQGSLTTPPCYESVNWIVFKEIQEVSEEQMGKFRSLVSNKPAETNDPLAPNYRPVQPVNGRPVRLFSRSAAAANVPPPPPPARSAATQVSKFCKYAIGSLLNGDPVTAEKHLFDALEAASKEQRR